MNNIVFNELGSDANFLPNEKFEPQIHPSAAIRNSQIAGNVIIDESVHVVNAVIRADEGTPFYIGKGSNIQDFCILHGYATRDGNIAVDDNYVNVDGKKYSIYIGVNVSASHGVLVHGPTYIGDNTFLGFKSTIDGARIGRNVEIGAHSYIKNVTIPDGIAIAPNSIITSNEDIKKYITNLSGINKKISKINHEMAEAYCNTVQYSS